MISLKTVKRVWGKRITVEAVDVRWITVEKLCSPRRGRSHHCTDACYAAQHGERRVLALGTIQEHRVVYKIRHPSGAEMLWWGGD